MLGPAVFMFLDACHPFIRKVFCTFVVYSELQVLLLAMFSFPGLFLKKNKLKQSYTAVVKS